MVCGLAWVREVYRQLSPKINLEAICKEADLAVANSVLIRLEGPTREILTGERTALNFLQLLSGIASKTRQYVDMVEHTKVHLLDTRKTIPSLRLAQKYAVTCGGGYNHRLGLFDAFLIKENHIKASGSIVKSVLKARTLSPNLKVEVEVEDLTQFREAITAQPDIIMLDNFNLNDLHKATQTNRGTIKLEVSGNISKENLVAVAETGVDYISIGHLTKNLTAVDLSLLIQ